MAKFLKYRGYRFILIPVLTLVLAAGLMACSGTSDNAGSDSPVSNVNSSADKSNSASGKTDKSTAVSNETDESTAASDQTENSAAAEDELTVSDIIKTDEESYLTKLLKGGIRTEAGSPLPELKDLLNSNLAEKGLALNNDTECSYLGDSTAIDTDLTGSYEIGINIAGVDYDAVIIVCDMTAPTAVITEQHIAAGDPYPAAEAFASDIEDYGSVTVAYESEPDASAAADTSVIPVGILLTDDSGNSVIYDSSIIIDADTEPPVFTDIPDTLEAECGGTLLWRAYIEAEDNSGQVTVTLDTSRVDTFTAGRYTAYAIATDPSGNETRQAITVRVTKLEVSEEMMDELCDSILSGIIKDGMTVQEQLKAVYEYIRSHISYNGDTPHDDVRREAYLGLTSRRYGDCFTYYAAGYELLTHLGYDVKMVRRRVDLAASRGNHFWCLVNCGTEEEPAWYHFDACVHGTYPLDSYMLTDLQVWAYTNMRNAKQSRARYYYTFDRDLVPASSETIMYDIGVDEIYYEHYYAPADSEGDLVNEDMEDPRLLNRSSDTDSGDEAGESENGASQDDGSGEETSVNDGSRNDSGEEASVNDGSRNDNGEETSVNDGAQNDNGEETSVNDGSQSDNGTDIINGQGIEYDE